MLAQRELWKFIGGHGAEVKALLLAGRAGWSAEGGWLELLAGQEFGGEALAEDPSLESLRQMSRTSWSQAHFLPSESLGPCDGTVSAAFTLRFPHSGSRTSSGVVPVPPMTWGAASSSRERNS